MGEKLRCASVALAALAVVSCGSTKASSGDGPCPEGTTLEGTAPPEGTLQWCAKGKEKQGPWTEWYPGGTLKAKGQYNRGKMSGHWVSYHEPPVEEPAAAGKPAKLAKLDNPVMQEEGDYDNGLKTGEWKTYYGDGKLNRIKTHKPGSTEIPWVTWRPTGEKWAEGTIVGMRNSGPYKEWHINGKLASEGTYDAKGEKVGEWKYWDQDGNPSTEEQGDMVDPNDGAAAEPPAP